MKRLNSDDRKKSIVEAATPLFAEKGFNGVTIKEIAQAAGVSEALLYKHFSSKEEMYEYMLDFVCSDADDYLNVTQQLPVNTSSLVACIYFLVKMIATGGNHDPNIHQITKKLLLHSLAEDGKFAKTFIESKSKGTIPMLSKLIQAAIDSGDLIEARGGALNGMWYCHHMGMALSMMWLPGITIVNYKLDKVEVVKSAVAFCLRGMGFTSEAIEKYYNPEIFEMMTAKQSQ